MSLSFVARTTQRVVDQNILYNAWENACIKSCAAYSEPWNGGLNRTMFITCCFLADSEVKWECENFLSLLANRR